jgi:ACS family hexuronate transporter-like MFS transporter
MRQPSPLWPWAVCGALLLATLLNYMDRQALAVTLPTLKQEFNLAEGRVGMVEGCFGFAFAFGAVFFGWLADRVGPRFLYPAVLTGWSLAGIATAWAGQPWVTSWFETVDDPPGTGVYRWLLICRVVLGACEAGHWPCALLTVRAILTAKDRTLGNGILQSGASIGAVLVPLYVEAAERAGQSWEFPFWSIGLAGLAWVPVWFLLVGTRDLSLPKVDEGISTPTAQSNHLARRLVVLAVIVATLTISWQFLRAWLALFLQDHHGYTKEATRGLMSGYFIAADVGCLLSGVLVTRLVARGWHIHSSRQAGYFLFTLLTGCGALVPFVGDGWLMIVLLFTAGAGILGLHPYYYALTQELSLRRMGVLSGALAAGGWIISSLSQIFLGRHIEATESYQLGLVIVGLAPAIGLAALLLFWPKKTTERDSRAPLVFSPGPSEFMEKT